MNFVLKPWQFALFVIARWVSREQQQVIEYLRTEHAVLREKLGEKRILLSDDQRRRLAVKGKVLGYKRLSEFETFSFPIRFCDGIANWWARSGTIRIERRQSPGRPRVRKAIVELTLKFATENPTCGSDRIQGARANLGYRIRDTTVGNIRLS